MRKVYKEKHDILLEELRPFLKKYRLSGEHAGLHVLLTSREPADEEALIRKAEEKGVRLYGLHEAALEPVAAGSHGAAGIRRAGKGRDKSGDCTAEGCAVECKRKRKERISWK